MNCNGSMAGMFNTPVANKVIVDMSKTLHMLQPRTDILRKWFMVPSYVGKFDMYGRRFGTIMPESCLFIIMAEF